MNQQELLAVAQVYHEQGFAIIPFIIDPVTKKKVPDTAKVPKWNQWQTQPQTNAEFDNLHIEKYTMFGVVCGTSFNVNGETVYFVGIDRDIKDPELTEEIKQKTLSALNDMKPYTRREKTRSGGQHLGYYSRKQAKGKKVNEIGMELLGAGNLIVMAPSEGYTLENDNDFSLVDDAEAIFYKALEEYGLYKKSSEGTSRKTQSKPAPLRPCFTKLMQKPHLEHLEKVALIYEMYYSGLAKSQVVDVFEENLAWEPSPEHTFDPKKTAEQITYTYNKAKEGNFRYKKETLVAEKICFKDCQYYDLKDCRKLHPTLTELLEKDPALKKIEDNDFKDYDTVENAFAWFIATLYLYDFSVREAHDAIDEIKSDTWIKSTNSFKERCFKKADKIINAETEEENSKGPEKSQADILYELLKDGKIEFFYDQNRIEYAYIPIELDGIDGIEGILSVKKSTDTDNTGTIDNSASHTPLLNNGNSVNAVNAVKTSHEIMKLNDEKFKTYMAHRLYDAEKKILYSDAATQVIRILKYDASQGKRYKLFNSVASDPSGDGSIWIDKRDKNHTAYHLSKSGWTVENPPILFSSFDHQKPLAEAVHGGDPRKLLPFVNVGANKSSILTKHKELLLMVQTVSYGFPEISHPINAMFGSPGSRKSTAQRFIRSIFDPSTAPLLRFPKDDQAAMQVLDHHYIPIFDNLASMPQWFSDILCGAVTGLGQETRSLYTNDDSFIRAFKRCILLNGVNLPPKNGDLLNRTIMHPTEPISERLTDEELETSFNKVLPEILGGFLDVIVKALNLKETVKVPKLFRLADFTQWGCALAVALGETVEDFIAAMDENLNSQNEADIAGNVVADAFLAYCKEKLSLLYPTEDNPTSDTPEEVFAFVTAQAESRKTNTKSKGWPSNASVFSRKLNGSKSAIIADGWNYEVVPKGSRREMQIWKIQGDKVPDPPEVKHFCFKECGNFDNKEGQCPKYGNLNQLSEMPCGCPSRVVPKKATKKKYVCEKCGLEYFKKTDDGQCNVSADGETICKGTLREEAS